MPIPSDCPDCAEFNAALIPNLVIELFLIPIVGILTIFLLVKCFKKRKLATYSLTIASLMLEIETLISAIANIQGVLLGYLLPWTRYLSPIAYILVCSAGYSFFLFCTDVFLAGMKQKIKVLYFLWGAFAATLTTLPANNWLNPGGDSTFRLISLIMVLSYMLVIFIITSKGAFYAASRIDRAEGDRKTSLRAIGTGAILQVASLISQVLQVVFNLFEGTGQWNLFGTLSWFFVGTGVMCWYVGFVPPQRLIRWYKRASNQPNHGLFWNLTFGFVLFSAFILCVITLGSLLIALFLPIIPSEVMYYSLAGVIVMSLIFLPLYKVNVKIKFSDQD